MTSLNQIRRRRPGAPLGFPVAVLLAFVAASFVSAARADENENGENANRETARTHRFDRAPNAVRAALNERAAEIIDDAERAAGTSTANAAERPSVGARARRLAATGGRMLADPRFAGAIVISDLANAGINRDPDAVDDTMHALTTPEFFAGLGLFNASMMAGEAVAARPFRALTGRVGAESLAGKAAGALKHNLVLAGALTVPRMIEVDFGGFTFGDAVKGDFSELSEASMNFRADIDAQDIGITLGAFAVAQPVWSGIKRIGGALARKVGARLARTAVVKGALAVAPVPGSRVVAGLLTAGEILWGAVDLAGLLFTAHKIEEPIKEWNDHRRSVNAVKESTDALLDLVDGDFTAEELDEKLREASMAFGNHRDFLYLPAAIKDVEFVDRLMRMGETKENMAALSNAVMDDFGAWLAMPGQTALLIDEYERRIAEAEATGDHSNIPGGDLEEFKAFFERHKERMREELEEIDSARRVDADEFDPWGEDFTPSANRREVFEQEIALYRRILESVDDPDIRSRLEAEIATLEAILDVDDGLRDASLGRDTMVATADEPEFFLDENGDVVLPLEPTEPPAPGMTDVLGENMFNVDDSEGLTADGEKPPYDKSGEQAADGAVAADVEAHHDAPAAPSFADAGSDDLSERENDILNAIRGSSGETVEPAAAPAVGAEVESNPTQSNSRNQANLPPLSGFDPSAEQDIERFDRNAPIRSAPADNAPGTDEFANRDLDLTPGFASPTGNPRLQPMDAPLPNGGKPATQAAPVQPVPENTIDLAELAQQFLGGATGDDDTSSDFEVPELGSFNQPAVGAAGGSAPSVGSAPSFGKGQPLPSAPQSTSPFAGFDPITPATPNIGSGPADGQLDLGSLFGGGDSSEPAAPSVPDLQQSRGGAASLPPLGNDLPSVGSNPRLSPMAPAQANGGKPASQPAPAQGLPANTIDLTDLGSLFGGGGDDDTSSDFEVPELGSFIPRDPNLGKQLGQQSGNRGEGPAILPNVGNDTVLPGSKGEAPAQDFLPSANPFDSLNVDGEAPASEAPAAEGDADAAAPSNGCASKKADAAADADSKADESADAESAEPNASKADESDANESSSESDAAPAKPASGCSSRNAETANAEAANVDAAPSTDEAPAAAPASGCNSRRRAIFAPKRARRSCGSSGASVQG